MKPNGMLSKFTDARILLSSTLCKSFSPLYDSDFEILWKFRFMF